MEKAKPKSVRIIHTNYLRSGYGENDITQELFTEAEVTYDDNGNILTERHFTPNGELESRVENNYDANGRAVDSAQFDSFDELCQKNVFSYGEDGRLERKGCFYGEGSPEYATVYVYEDGRLVREDAYDEEEFVCTEKAYEYDGNGHVSKTTEYDEDGNVLYRTTDEYDAEGRLAKRLREEPQEHDSRTFVYAYDEQGHKTKELMYNLDGKLIAKAYYRYDEMGNNIEMEEENLDIFRLTQYTYEGTNCVKITQFDKDKMALSYSAYEYNDNGDVVRIENHNRDEVDPSVLRTVSAVEYQIEY